MGRLERAIDVLVYASVALGLAFVYAASSIVPVWLLAAIVAGEISYGVVAAALALGYERAYPAVLVLALVVLAVSLPQPEHYSFAVNGMFAQFLIFAVGSATQIALVVLIPVHLWRGRHAGLGTRRVPP